METAYKLNFYRTTKFLWKYIKDLRMRYILFYMGWLFQTIVEIITPIVFGMMINQVVYNNNLTAFIKIGLIYLGITVFGIILYYGLYEMYGVLWNRINRSLRMGMFEQLQKLSANEMTSLNHGETVNMIQFWSSEGVHFMIRNIVHNINNIFRILICVSIIFWVNPVFGFITVLMVPVSVLATFKIGNRVRNNAEKNNDNYSKYISWLFEIASSLSELRLWGAKSEILKKYDEKLKEINRLDAKIEMDNTVGGEVVANIKNFILVIQYVLLAYFAINNDLKVGVITVMLTYFTMLSSSLSRLVTNHMDAQKRIAVIERIYNFLGKESCDQCGDKYDLEEDINEITFRNCSFRYSSENPLILDKVNFSIHRGEKVAIVGSSGSGKSTLLNLMLGLYQPVEGNLLLNGTDISKYNPSSLYEHISAVSQQVLLFKGTIRDNLQMGENITETDLVKACQAAGIYEYVLEQEKGFDTVIERRGENLSGGQRQRIGIARAYLRKADLVIMDEATASLDDENEKVILNKWDEVLQGKTCVVVSHRISTVMSCDRVILLKDGKIHAMGTPIELKEHCLELRKLFAL